jgi:hypothetical protein
VQWNARTSVCSYAALPYDPAGTTGMKLKYKLPPSSMGAASSLKNATRAKMIASGFYARCAIPADAAARAAWLQAGVALAVDHAQNYKWGAAGVWDTGVSELDCQRKCDESVVCWGFFFNADAGACLYRGGEDALATRSFFVMPSVSTVSAASAGGGGSGGPSGGSSGGSSGSNGGLPQPLPLPLPPPPPPPSPPPLPSPPPPRECCAAV